MTSRSPTSAAEVVAVVDVIESALGSRKSGAGRVGGVGKGTSEVDVCGLC